MQEMVHWLPARVGEEQRLFSARAAVGRLAWESPPCRYPYRSSPPLIRWLRHRKMLDCLAAIGSALFIRSRRREPVSIGRSLPSLSLCLNAQVGEGDSRFSR